MSPSATARRQATARRGQSGRRHAAGRARARPVTRSRGRRRRAQQPGLRRPSLPAVISGVGEALLTIGLVVALFAVYELYWTGVETQRAQNRLTDDLRDAWTDAPAADEPVPGAQLGDGVALLSIPRLGSDWVVVEGVRGEDLKKGPGHYPGTALPGEVGNFAVAGHRATNGEPFRRLDELEPGDPLVVETRDAWFTYVVTGTEITSPADVDVIAPVPGRPGEEPTERLMTLTTCHPRWSSEFRMIVYSELAERRDKADGPPAALEGMGD